MSVETRKVSKEINFSLRTFLLLANQVPLKERMGGATACSWLGKIREKEQRSEGSKDSAHLHVLPLPPIGSLALLATVYPGRGESRLVPPLLASKEEVKK